MASPLYCPHCNSGLGAHDDARGGRCDTCRLVVGAGRARAQPDGESRPGGFMANAAKREEAAPVSAEAAWAALAEAAEQAGCRVERMRMTDYDKLVHEGAVDVTVAQILATFDSWKSARNGAREGLAADAAAEVAHGGSPAADDDLAAGVG